MRTWPALVLTFPADASADAQDLVSAELDGLDVVAIDEPGLGVWRVCFREDEARLEAVARLSGVLGLSVERLDMPDDDWARRSQEALTAIRVGPVVVTPPWDKAATHPAQDALTVVIEPGMGFGSGHHATTRLCLGALQLAAPAGKSVIDIGTGSGVLAITAAMLGASSVLALDNDPDAVESAQGNAARNAVPAGLEFRVVDFRKTVLPRHDIVLANLTGGMLLAAVDDVMRTAVAGGTVILSGITTDEGDAVLAAFARRGMMVSRDEEAGWIGLVFRA